MSFGRKDNRRETPIRSLPIARIPTAKRKGPNTMQVYLSARIEVQQNAALVLAATNLCCTISAY